MQKNIIKFISTNCQLHHRLEMQCFMAYGYCFGFTSSPRCEADQGMTMCRPHKILLCTPMLCNQTSRCDSQLLQKRGVITISKKNNCPKGWPFLNSKKQTAKFQITCAVNNVCGCETDFHNMHKLLPTGSIPHIQHLQLCWNGTESNFICCSSQLF